MDLSEKDEIEKKRLSERHLNIQEIIARILPRKKYLEDGKEEYIKEERIFSQTFSNMSLAQQRKRKKPQRWSEQDTQTFYKCLEFFGLDFQMIKGVLSQKTKRQLLRKYHKEKKINTEKIDEILKNHESNLIEKNTQCKSFLENLFNNTSGSDLFSDKISDNSLDEVVNKKLKLVMTGKNNQHLEYIQEESLEKFKFDEKILPLEVYFDQFDI
jgi:hypothetical protein